MGGGGKGGNTETKGTTSSSGTSTTQLPDWVTNASQAALASGQQLAAQPYTPYTGQLVAGQTGDTTQAAQQIRDLQGATSPAYDAASNQWGSVLGNLASLTPDQQNAATNALYGNYQQQVMNPAQGLLGGYLQGGPLTAGQVGQGAQALMSPYTQSVIDPTNQLMQQQLHQNLQTIGAGANQAGAFGGSRQGVQEGVAQSQAALGSEQYLGNLLNNQWGNALTTANSIGQLGSQQGYNAAGALANLGQQGYGNAQTSAQNLLGTNLGLGTQAAQQIPGLAANQQAANLQATGALQGVGTAEQQQAQSLLSTQYGQFQQQQAFPYQQQEELLSTLAGIPYGTTTNTTGTSTGQQTAQNNPSIMSQISQGAGLASSLLGFL